MKGKHLKLIEFDVRFATKNHPFWRAFCRNHFRRVEMLMLEFRRKIIDCGVLFVKVDEKSSILAWLLTHLASACRLFEVEFWRLSAVIIHDFGVLFAALTFCVSTLVEFWRLSEVVVLACQTTFFDDFGHVSAPVFERFSVCRWWFYRFRF